MVAGKSFVIIDYGMGNLRSVSNALRFLGCDAVISNRVEDISKADALVLPGVGAFEEAMNNLTGLGLVAILKQKVMEEKKPLLGICLGMQLLAGSSQENGLHQGLGFIEGNVIRIPVDKSLPLPHVGWNNIEVMKSEPLFRKIGKDTNFYFVHSYCLDCDDAIVSSYCDYGVRIVASIQKDNILATQFHPEKSQTNGLRLLRGFTDIVYGKTPVEEKKYA